MSNSTLVTYKHIVSHKTKGRGGKTIQKIFVHHMAGNLTVKQCGAVFDKREASAHYGVNGKNIGQYVDESDTAWHCGNFNWNQRSIGIELANDGDASTNWHVSDTTINTAIKLIADICKRNGIKKLNYTGDMSGNLCMHRWVASTACPGTYLSKQFKKIANGVNKILEAKSETTTVDIYRVRKTWKDEKSQIGAFADLSNAKKLCDEHPGYSVFDPDGKVIYTKPVEELYRVRKTWTDEKSQIGAYKELGNAKKICDEHPGYSVFDKSGKAVYTSDVSWVEKANTWAKKIAADNTYHYVKWKSKDVKTHQCPICNNFPKGTYHGWNCIGFTYAVWHHGGGLPCKCNDGVISSDVGTKMLQMTNAKALAEAKKRVGLNDLKVIINKNGIPKSQWKAGDICMQYKSDKYFHNFYYMGDGKIAESTGSSGKIPNDEQIRVKGYSGKTAKIIIRYTGK